MVDEQTAAPVAAATPVKPGWKTTEFWLHAISMVVGIVMASGISGDSVVMKVAGMAAMLLSALGYGVQRVSLKNSAMALPFILALGLLSGCSAIDKKTLQEFQSDEVLILKDMAQYVAADVAAGKTPVYSQAALDAHLAKINSDPRSVDPAEEQAILAQFIAYIAADAKLSSGTVKAWGGEVKGHLDLFTSVHR